MSFFGGVDDLERFLTRSCYMSVVSVPACWGLMVFLANDVGWRFSYLLTGVIPLVAAYLGVRGKREIRTGMALGALGLALVSTPLMLYLAHIEG
ncbi:MULTISPECIES: hypothetical protein [unclassified Streptomyces]|uniref:hypothetical protein n=1 Tax=unclassified Streptomyces TaxID=2593676 RepID=UPI003404EAC5